MNFAESEILGVDQSMERYLKYERIDCKEI